MYHYFNSGYGGWITYLHIFLLVFQSNKLAFAFSVMDSDNVISKSYVWLRDMWRVVIFMSTWSSLSPPTAVCTVICIIGVFWFLQDGLLDQRGLWRLFHCVIPIFHYSFSHNSRFVVITCPLKQLGNSTLICRILYPNLAWVHTCAADWLTSVQLLLSLLSLSSGAANMSTKELASLAQHAALWLSMHVFSDVNVDKVICCSVTSSSLSYVTDIIEYSKLDIMCSWISNILS